jgi:hypothetical protein
MTLNEEPSPNTSKEKMKVKYSSPRDPSRRRVMQSAAGAAVLLGGRKPDAGHETTYFNEHTFPVLLDKNKF